MAPRVVVHIGLQKSGTTYLQRILQQVVDQLAEAGIGYPLPPVRAPSVQQRRRAEYNHERATHGLLGAEYHWVSEHRRERGRAQWQWLAEQVRAHPGTVLLSAEGLSVIRAQGIERLVDELGGDVSVVVTVRDLGRILPSSWQQHIRNGRLSSFGHYLRDLADQRDRPLRDREDVPELHFWRAYALGGMARRWADAVGPDRIHVVTNPREAPPEGLWSRFCQATGIPADAVDPPEHLLKQRTHAALTAPEAAVFVSLNATLEEAGWSRKEARALRERIIAGGFAHRAERGPRLVVPKEWRTWVAAWSEEDVAQLADSGVAILGDLGDLRYDPALDEVPAPSPEDVARAAGAAVLATTTTTTTTESAATEADARRRDADAPSSGSPKTSDRAASQPRSTAPYRRAARWMRRRAHRLSSR